MATRAMVITLDNVHTAIACYNAIPEVVKTSLATTVPVNPVIKIIIGYVFVTGYALDEDHATYAVDCVPIVLTRACSHWDISFRMWTVDDNFAAELTAKSTKTIYHIRMDAEPIWYGLLGNFQKMEEAVMQIIGDLNVGPAAEDSCREHLARGLVRCSRWLGRAAMDPTIHGPSWRTRADWCGVCGSAKGSAPDTLCARKCYACGSPCDECLVAVNAPTCTDSKLPYRPEWSTPPVPAAA